MYVCMYVCMYVVCLGGANVTYLVRSAQQGRIRIRIRIRMGWDGIEIAQKIDRFVRTGYVRGWQAWAAGVSQCSLPHQPF